MVRENRKISERIIKIIDWISRIMAVFLAISGALLQMLFGFGVARSNESLLWIAISSIIIWTIPQVGLFFAPDAKQRGIVCRFGTGILMLPSFVLLLAILINSFNVPIHVVLIVMFGLIIYITQYCLLFSNIKITIDIWEIKKKVKGVLGKSVRESVLTSVTQNIKKSNVL